VPRPGLACPRTPAEACKAVRSPVGAALHIASAQSRRADGRVGQGRAGALDIQRVAVWVNEQEACNARPPVLWVGLTEDRLEVFCGCVLYRGLILDRFGRLCREGVKIYAQTRQTLLNGLRFSVQRVQIV
jgi:hypothetical protein